MEGLEVQGNREETFRLQMALGQDKTAELHFVGTTWEMYETVSRTKARGEHMQMVCFEGVDLILW